MTTTIPEQVTLTLNKDIGKLLAHFLHAHGYEFRRLYDEQQKIERDPILRGVPSMESRTALFELIALFREENTTHDPSNSLHRLRVPRKID